MFTHTYRHTSTHIHTHTYTHSDTHTYTHTSEYLRLEAEAAAETDVRTVRIVSQHVNLKVVVVPIAIGA